MLKGWKPPFFIFLLEEGGTDKKHHIYAGTYTDKLCIWKYPCRVQVKQKTIPYNEITEIDR
jgi:hypothetical protein